MPLSTVHEIITIVRRFFTTLFLFLTLLTATNHAAAIPFPQAELSHEITNTPDLIAQDTPRGFYRIPVRGGRGLQDQLTDIATVAAAQGLTAIVELSADWCSSCLVLEQYLALPQTEIDLDGVLLVELNIDLFPNAELQNVGMDAPSIPTAYLLGSDGRAIGGPRPVGGDTYEEAIESLRVMVPTDDAVSHPWE